MRKPGDGANKTGQGKHSFYQPRTILFKYWQYSDDKCMRLETNIKVVVGLH